MSEKFVSKAAVENRDGLDWFKHTTCSHINNEEYNKNYGQNKFDLEESALNLSVSVGPTYLPRIVSQLGVFSTTRMSVLVCYHSQQDINLNYIGPRTLT